MGCKMKIMILCSKHFYGRIPPIRDYLLKRGHEVKMPNSFDEPMKEEKIMGWGRKGHIVWKGEMMKKDEENIRPQDAVLVLNLEKKGIPNYIGGATFLEVYMAWKLNKRIFFYNSLPRCSFTDELVGINPKILNGDLNKIC